ncbi:hypothetical protein N9R55_01565 [Porticoccaceae bacterium]|jgi:hypothetical protein|nr:hypothetical protein [Porticoccaceae bacterium]
MKNFGQLSLRLVLTMAFVIASNAFSDDGGNAAVTEFQDGKVEAPRGLSSSQKAGNVLRKLARDKGFKVGGWDDKKNRIMVIKQTGEAIDAYDPDFLQKREALAIEASLLAKATIIESFTTTASAENILSVPGNPIAKQLEAEQKQIKAMEAQAQKFYMQAQRETSVLLSAYDQAQADELRGVTFGDRLNSLLEATIKKLDETFDSQQITEDKKQRLSDVKMRLDKARKIEDEKQKLLEEVQNKIAELQGQVKKETRSAIETTSSMPLFGATTLMQVESYDDLRGQYNIASLVVWSPKLELEARGMLLGAGKGKPRKNKISIDEWLDKQNLSSMVGARRYLASDGSTNFMGISAVEYDPDDSGSYSMLEEEAILWAKQAAILSLKASVESVKSAERLKRDIRGADGKVESKILKDFSANIQESVKNLTIRGLETLRIEETVHEPTGKNIIVAVANVNSALAVKASDIMKDMYATLKEVNADQSFIQGEEAGMKAEADKTLNNKAIFDAGMAAGSNQVATEYDSRADDRASLGREQPQQSKEPVIGDNSDSSAESQSGSWAGDIEVDDDF